MKLFLKIWRQKNKQTKGKIIDYEIDKLLEERNNYRKVKEFEKADNIRKILAEKGIGIIDNNNGTSSWEKL